MSSSEYVMSAAPFWGPVIDAAPVTFDSETPSVNGSARTAYDWRIHVGNTFPDEPSSDLFYTYVERLVHNHVTFGSGGLYQPNGHVHRDAMAAFIARAFAGGDANVPDSGTISSADNPVINGAYDCTAGPSLFSDVPVGSQFCKHIHYLAGINVTQGDGTGKYLPGQNVARSTMAVFVSRALFPTLGDAGVPDANTGTGPFSTRTYDCTNGPAPFLDVPLGGTCKNIGYIWTLGIVDGDGTGRFSPTSLVTRGQMSKFLDNAFALSIGPAN